MKLNNEQMKFIEECSNKEPLTITGKQLADAILHFVALGGNELERDKEKSIALCEKLVAKGLRDCQIRSQLALRSYFRRVLQADPTALNYMIDTARDRLQLKESN